MEKNNTILDYIAWRGDLSFSASPFCDVDALIFAQLSYLDFSKIVGADFENGKTLKDVCEAFCNSADFNERKHLGLVINPLSVDLLLEAGKSARFGGVTLSGFDFRYNKDAEEQFCALTFSFLDCHFVAFRGTDDTIVGWKEDFNLAFCEKVQAQADSAEYISRALDFFDGSFRIGGHSKGGNLAIFAASSVSDFDFSRIRAVYNFDGPGFPKETLSRPAFLKIQPLVHTVYPQFSVVGQLFSHFDEYTVTKSTGSLLLQHDPFTWLVKGARFDEKQHLDEGSERFSRAFNGWLSKIDGEKRELFVEATFTILKATKSGSLTEIHADSFRASALMVRAMTKLDDETRSAVLEIAGNFIKEAGRAFSENANQTQ